MTETDASKLPPQRITDKNLINQVKTPPPIVQPTYYKPLIIDALSLISALWLGFAYSQFLGGGSGTVLLLSLGIFSTLSALQLFFTKAFKRRILILALQTICILIPFYGYALTFLAAAGGIFIFFTAWGELLAYGELENSLEIRFFKAARLSLKKLTTALVLLLIILYLPQWDEKRAFIPRENFKSLYGWTTDMTKNFYPDIDFNSTFTALARSFARSELKGAKEFNSLSEPDKEHMIEQSSNQIVASMGASLGVEISPGDLTMDIFYNSILKLLANLKDRFKQWFLLIWALAVFLVIRGFGVIFYWIVMFVSFILYELLLTSGFTRIIGVSKTHEVMDF